MKAKCYGAFALAALALALVPAASAGQGNPTPDQLSAALALAAANPNPPAIGGFDGQARMISPRQALSAGQAAGADTSIAPGLTARQAVGLDVVPASVLGRLGLDTGSDRSTASVRRLSSRTMAAASVYCWSDSVSETFGIWPLEQDLFDDAYWCGYYNGSITYRSQTPHQGGRFCNPAGTYVYTTYWYSGSPIWRYRVGGNWNCQGINQSASFGVNISSSGLMWRS